MLPEGFPLIPDLVPDVSLLGLTLLAAAILVVMVTAIFLADRWQQREQAGKGIISELPSREEKAA